MNHTPAPVSSIFLIRWLDAIAEFTGNTTAWLTGIMVVSACIVVGLRHVFGVGSIALQESVTYMHALVFMLGAAYTLKRGGHVRVDIVYRRMSVRTCALRKAKRLCASSACAWLMTGLLVSIQPMCRSHLPQLSTLICWLKAVLCVICAICRSLTAIVCSARWKPSPRLRQKPNCCVRISAHRCCLSNG